MAFLNPWLLLGLAGVGVPIAIHLLNRFRPKKVAWAAMDLLRQATVVRSRQVQLEDLILLLLRCLAILLLALALARPTLTGLGASLLGGGGAGAIIAIDGSYSMSHQTGLTSRFDQAVNRVSDIASTLSPGDPFTLAVLGRRPRVVVRNSGFDAAGLTDIQKDLAPLPEGLDLDHSLEELIRLAQEMRAPVRECYLITDAQATSFAHLSDSARRGLDQLAQVARVFVVPVTSESQDNVAITSLELTSGVLRVGGSGRFVAEVRNLGPTEARGVSVTLHRGDEAIERKTLDAISPGQSVRVTLLARFDAPGATRFTAAIGPDPIVLDNVRHALVVVREQVRVLAVDGDPSPTPYEGEADFVRTALSPRRDAIPGVPTLDVRVVPWPELATQRLEDYDLVVLANVADVRADVAGPLQRYVERGGGLVLLAGDNVNPEVWNQRLGSVLPATLGPATGDAEDRERGWRVEAARASHPLAQPWASLPGDLRDELRVHRALAATPVEGAEVVLQLTDGPGTQPLLVERVRAGQGHVVLSTIPATRAWSDWVIHPLFPMLVQQSVTHMLREPQEVPQTVGEALMVPLPPEAAASAVTFVDPSGELTNVQPAEREGRRLAELTEAALPGFYEVRLDDRGGAALQLAANLDTGESNATALDVAALREALGDLPVRVIDNPDALRTAIRESRVGRELWRELAMLALAVLVIEAVLARRFSGRMKGGASPVITGRLSPIRRERVILDEQAA